MFDLENFSQQTAEIVVRPKKIGFFFIKRLLVLCFLWSSKFGTKKTVRPSSPAAKSAAVVTEDNLNGQHGRRRGGWLFCLLLA
jgi:hypothetical protein